MPYSTDRGDYVFIPPVELETMSARAIMGEASSDQPGLLDAALEEFLSKNSDYEDASDALGLIGQVADLWRKVVKLKKAVIDGADLNGEDPSQLIRDIFGHSLLALYYDDHRPVPVRGRSTIREEVINAAAPDPGFVKTFRDSVLAMREDGATWKGIKGFLEEMEKIDRVEKPVF